MNQTVVVQTAPIVGPEPAMVMCPKCQNNIITRVDYESTTKTHLCAGLLCFTCLWCFACIPYCTPCCRATNHYCPNCNTFLGSYNM